MTVSLTEDQITALNTDGNLSSDYDYEASRAEQNDYEEQLATGDTFSLHVDASFIFQDQNTLEVSTETIETAWESQGNDNASS